MARIIDAHVHVGFRGKLAGQTGREIIEKMDRAGVAQAVVFPYTEGTFSNTPVMEYAKEAPDRLIPFCSINPWNRKDAYDELERCLEEGYKGIKLHPSGSGYRLSDLNLLGPAFELLRQYRCPAIVHGAGDLLNSPTQFAFVCKHFPDVDFIMAHSGYFWLVDEAIDVARENENLYLEVSRIPLFEINQIIASVPADHIIWGTDAPFVEYTEECMKMSKANCSAADYDLIMGGNIARILGL